MRLYRYEFYNGAHWSTQSTLEDHMGVRMGKKRQVYPTGYVDAGDIVPLEQPDCAHNDMEFFNGQFVCSDCDKKFKATAFEEIKERK